MPAVLSVNILLILLIVLRLHYRQSVQSEEVCLPGLAKFDACILSTLNYDTDTISSVKYFCCL